MVWKLLNYFIKLVFIYCNVVCVEVDCIGVEFRELIGEDL